MLRSILVAKFKKYKGAIKLNTQLDLKTNIPSFIHITDGSVHDVNYLNVMDIEANSNYISDRGYVDFARLCNIHYHKTYFVTRLKTNTNYRRLYCRKMDKTTSLLATKKLNSIIIISTKKTPENEYE